MSQENNESPTVPEALQVEKVKGYQSYYQDASGTSHFEIIEIPFRESYVKTFKNELPTEAKYKKWKDDNKVIVIQEDSIEQLGSKKGHEGYKFSKSCGKMIYDYLNTRPMAEVEGFIFQMFENPKQPDPFFNEEGIKLLTKYFQEKCPRIEAKPIIEALDNGGLEKYVISPIEKKPEDSESSEAGKNGEESKENNTSEPEN